MKITFIVDGQVINLDAFGAGVGDLVMKLRIVREDFERKLAGVVDPATGRAPEITVTGKSADKMELKISGSDKVQREVRTRLGLDAR